MGITSFEKDLEFIQLLCNPEYIRWLFSENYFTNDAFLQYLKHLLYFDTDKFRKFLFYPQAIPILKKLLEPGIKQELKDEQFYTQLSNEQFFMWKNRKQ